jgi:hypothetical protein
MSQAVELCQIFKTSDSRNVHLQDLKLSVNTYTWHKLMNKY